MKFRFVVLLTLMLVGGVNAAVTYTENFEDETVGETPTGTFYTYTGSGVVANTGLDGTTKAVSVSRSGVNQFDEIEVFELNYTEISFYALATSHESCTFQVLGADNSQITILSTSDNPGFDNWFVNPGNTEIAPDATLEYFFRLVFDYDANTVSYFVDGAATPNATKGFINDVTPAKLQIGSYSSACDLTIDELTLTADEGPDTGGTPPTEGPIAVFIAWLAGLLGFTETATGNLLGAVVVIGVMVFIARGTDAPVIACIAGTVVAGGLWVAGLFPTVLLFLMGIGLVLAAALAFNARSGAQ